MTTYIIISPTVHVFIIIREINIYVSVVIYNTSLILLKFQIYKKKYYYEYIQNFKMKGTTQYISKSQLIYILIFMYFFKVQFAIDVL